MCDVLRKHDKFFPFTQFPDFDIHYVAGLMSKNDAKDM